MTEIKVQTLTPKRNLITVLPDPIEKAEKAADEIELPDIAKPVVIPRTGTVTRCGPDVDPVKTQLMERVLFGAYAGTEIEIGGVVELLMADSDILAGI